MNLSPVPSSFLHTFGSIILTFVNLRLLARPWVSFTRPHPPVKHREPNFSDKIFHLKIRVWHERLFGTRSHGTFEIGTKISWTVAGQKSAGHSRDKNLRNSPGTKTCRAVPVQKFAGPSREKCCRTRNSDLQPRESPVFLELYVMRVALFKAEIKINLRFFD